jgi:dihydroorotate dehydrogenase
VQAVKNIDRKTKPAIMVKVSPDEDTEEQVLGICEAIWDSGVDGVIVGNTTKRGPDPIPKGYRIPSTEAAVLLEQGGYSGPQMFERTRDLVKRYRRTLDNGPRQVPSSPSSAKSKVEPPVAGHATGDEPDSSILDKLSSSSTSPKASSPNNPASPSVTASIPTEVTPPPTNMDDLAESAPTIAVQPSRYAKDPAPAPGTAGSRKVIFATGGITNGRQAREILDAGASVAQVYTAIVYGGVGTISRIKEEMREEAKKR